jgi:hypothetical protein
MIRYTRRISMSSDLAATRLTCETAAHLPWTAFWSGTGCRKPMPPGDIHESRLRSRAPPPGGGSSGTWTWNSPGSPVDSDRPRRCAAAGVSRAAGQAESGQESGAGDAGDGGDAVCCAKTRSWRLTWRFAFTRLWVPRTSSTSCDQAVFVDHAAEARVSSDTVLLKIDRFE